MARPRRDAIDGLYRILAAACGVRLDGPGDVLPYSPAMLEGLAQSGKPIGRS